MKGTLYGTTRMGGTARKCPFSSTCGTIFSITTSGKERVLHSFEAGSDGAWPEAPLLNVKGTLYGTTSVDFGVGDGTVYSISTSGSEKVLYIFQGGSDGDSPTAGLIDVNGNFYGTTNYGGDSRCHQGQGCGTVFKLSP